MYESKDMMVSHPEHYKGTMGVEPIDYIHELCKNILDSVRINATMNYAHTLLAFDLGQIVKYICRYTKKNGSQDIDKARWYMQDFIDSVWQVVPGVSAKSPKKLTGKEIVDVTNTIVVGTNGAALRLWVYALCDQNNYICTGEEIDMKITVFELCWIVSKDYRNVTNVLTLQTALDYLYNIVKEREVEENARKVLC